MFNLIKVIFMVSFLMVNFSSHAATMTVGKSEEITYIKFEGKIVKGDAIKFKRIINKWDAKGMPIDVILLNSNGGDGYESYDIIDVILDNEIDTMVTPGSVCVSACVGIFAAGNERILYPTSKVGVHRASNSKKDNDLARGFSIELMEVYKDLDIPDSIRLKMIETPPNEVYYLTVDEMKEFSSDESPFTSTKINTGSVSAVGDFNKIANELTEKGIKFIQNKQYDEAIDALSKAYNINNTNITTVYSLGLSYFNKKEYKKAKSLYAESLKIDSTFSAAWRGYGFIHVVDGDVNAAADCFVHYWMYSKNKTKALNDLFSWGKSTNVILKEAAKRARVKLGIKDSDSL